MMQGQTVRIVSQTICYIEEHLHEKIDLDMAASALHYSKYHLHRIFTNIVGLTIHDYAKRRQLTEAAKLLVFSARPIIEIALISGYESQQAFTDIFKAMYKTSPARFRETENFYPLQLEIHLKEEPVKMDLTKDNIKFAIPTDVDDWMELVSFTIDGYPCLDIDNYITNLHQYIADKKALILRDDDMAIGVMGFSTDTGSIDFLAVHPQYRHLGITKLFLDKLADELIYGKEITVTTHVETVCLLSKLHSDQHIEVELKMDELDLTAAESKATYAEIKDYVLEHTGLKVSSLYIAQIKEKCGIIERVNYNLPKSENSRQPKCPPEKEKAIRDALEYFRMI